MPAYVYILRCADNTLYTDGQTTSMRASKRTTKGAAPNTPVPDVRQRSFT